MNDEKLAYAMIAQAFKGAAAFMGCTPQKALDIEPLLPLIKEEIKKVLNPAYDDLLQAKEAHMLQIGLMTFEATIFQAGIQAAQRLEEAASAQFN